MRTVDIPAGTIAYTDDGQGPPVVLLHGVLMNHTVWDAVLPRLAGGFRVIRPDLPFGAHPVPLRPGTDLSLRGLGQLLADFLDALDLHAVTLVHSDWGGGLFLTAYGLDKRVGRLVICPCEAFGNFPPGWPGKVSALAARMPGGLALGVRQLRVGWLRRSPLMLGQMAKHGVSDELIRAWTEPGIRDPRVLRDLRKYATTTFDPARLIADTEALATFTGDALVLWAPENRVMPPEHGHRLAELIPNARLREIPDAYVLTMLDQPATVAAELNAFLGAS
jgi:pimeloyl-ACP methyl ester carboxylesterase